MNKLLRNQKGNIPVTILVLGVLLICGLMIFSFYLGGKAVSDKISDISIIEKAKLEKEKLDFYRDVLNRNDLEAKNSIEGFRESDAHGKHLFLEKGEISVIYKVP